MAKRSHRKGKTVFVLGAGFTLPARGPTQSELLELITASRPLRPFLKRFFAKVFCARTEDQISRLSLEDVFTVLDRAVLLKENVRGFAHSQADEFRRILVREIVRILNERLDYPCAPHTRFARRLLEKRAEAGPDDDPFSIISFNWDVLLDKTLYSVCEEAQDLPPARIDYCCSTFNLGQPSDCNEQHFSSMLAPPNGRLNLKVLKLHGSVNWLLCPQCARLFVSFDESRALRNRNACPGCAERPPLEPLIITPTLLKDLQTIQLKTVWHNALMELQDARRIVFVGYSFPMADFEFRYLLAKSVRNDAQVVVISRPRAHAEKLPQAKRAAFLSEKQALQQRYQGFFGTRAITFPEMDARAFLESDPFD